MNEIKFTNYRKVLILIFLLAFTIRLIFALYISEIPASDAYVYDQLAISLSQDKGYVNVDGTAHSFYPPFYPFFLSIIYRFFGHNYAAVMIVQSVIGALTCVLVYSIGRRLGGAMAGALSACLCAVYPPFIKSAGLLLTELLFTFLLSLIVYYLLKIRENTHYKDCIMLGLLLGISALTKSALVILSIFIIPVFINKEDALKKYIVVVLFFALVISPWVIRNYSIYHKFVPIATQGGITFYSSYKPPNGIFGLLASGASDPVITEAGRIQDPILYNNFLVKKTLDFIINNPKEVMLLEFKKILYLWAPFDWEIVGGRWFNFMYTAMLPFFVLGIFFAFQDFMRFYPVTMPIFYFQIVTLVFYGSPRFRLPIEPYIFILGFIGLLLFLKWIRKHRVFALYRQG